MLFKEYHYDPSVKANEKKQAELKLLFKEYVLFGGYPKVALINEIELKEKRLQQIIDTYIKKDIKELANIDNLENIYYWRTKDKKEIDFIIKDKSRVIPAEVKINFNKAGLSAIRYFLENYRLSEYRVIGLDGYEQKAGQVYPWEI